ncbi:MAG: hypothetical protein KAU48_10950 [Candidatus Thorarchaeota archaeon]|nr:hypothetical protein [Candidatus Thorarchaeota archaeon]
MGVLRKLGLGILVYVIIGVVLTILLLNDIISIHEGNILINILFMIFQPIIILVNFLYYTMPFLP